MNFEYILEYYLQNTNVRTESPFIKIERPPYELDPRHETIAMARGYRIEKDQRTGQYFAMYGN